MRKVTVEVATLADAAARANRIAPTKGAAVDRASGIVIELDPSNTDEPLVLKSTNLLVSFRQSVATLELGDEPATWRVPSQLFAGALGTFPMALGSTVMLADNGDSNLYFKSGKIKAKLRLIGGDYPIIDRYDPDDLGTVSGLAKRLQQVAWATDIRSTGVLSGVHLDGEYLYGANTAMLAMVPCEVPIDAPVTAPLTTIAALLKNTSELKLRANDNHLQLMPDEYTQTTAVLFADPYPDIKALMERAKFDQQATVDAEALTAALDRMQVLVKSERLPVTSIEMGDNVMKLEMEVPEVGKIADEIAIDGGSTKPFKIMFTPGNLQAATAASGKSKITLDYGPTNLDPVRVTDDDGFTALLMPRKGDSS